MNFIIPIILIMISIGTFFMYIDPVYSGDTKKGTTGIKQLLKDKEKIDFQTDKIREIQQKKKELEKDYNNLNASNEYYLEYLNKMIPDNMENARLLNYIYTIKQRSVISGMSDLRISVQGNNQSKQNGKIIVQEDKDYKSVNLSFNFTSDYKNFKQFINNLYKSLRVVDVVSLSLSPEKGDDENLFQDKFSFDIIIRTYWLNK